MTMTNDSNAAALRAANLAFAARYPGEAGARQPVHTVYGGAQLFGSDAARKLGNVAMRALREYAPDAEHMGRALGISDHPALDTVFARVVEKLEREPVEDFRIDFEDGYGNRPDAEEDGHAESVAEALAKGMKEGTLPPFIGIRIKPLNEELRARAMRTLEIVLTKLVEKAGGLPENFVVTVPKIVILEQVEYIVAELARIERKLGLADGSLRFEVMVEMPQIVLDSEGRSLLPRIPAVSAGRLTGAHFGTYDYTAGVNITAAHQRMRHPACDFAKHFMQVSLAGTGVWLSDGSTTVMPVPIHRAMAGEILTAEQDDDNCASVHGAWKLHFDDVTHSLVGGFYQGWDLHPAQLVTRYAALYAFFLAGIDAAAARLSNFVNKAAQATLVGDVFDDAATGQGLLNFFLRGVNSAAITEEDAVAMTGLSVEELRGRSFTKILNNRSGKRAAG
ncbi:MAG: phosphoenolpyruvate kinase [Gemmatimonadaceae bacterium]